MPSRHLALPALKPAAILGGIFVAFFAQMQALVYLSLIDYRPVMYVQRFFPQLDFSDFIIATRDWLNGINPYLRHQFDKPPVALLVALPLQHLTPSRAALVFFLANALILVAALAAVCRHFKLSRLEALLFFGIASMYFPVLFLIERGNLDGIILGLILMVIFAKRPFIRALGLALSVGIKVYGALLFAPLMAARRWRLATLAIGLIVLLLLPFHSLLLPFAHRITQRSGEFYLTENVSPGIFTVFFIDGAAKIGYYGFWLLSYGAMLSRLRNRPLETRMMYSLPWMLAMPMHIYPYTGVVLLPVLALRSREMASEVVTRGAVTSRDGIFLLGFLMTGFQQTAWLNYFHVSLIARLIASLTNPAGTAMIIGSLAWGAVLPAPEPPAATNSGIHTNAGLAA